VWQADQAANASAWGHRSEVDPSTRWAYESKFGRHIRPLRGSLLLTRLNAGALDSFYAELRPCRDHCDRRPHFQRKVAAGPTVARVRGSRPLINLA
jgi:hypothetical protein